MYAPLADSVVRRIPSMCRAKQHTEKKAGAEGLAPYHVWGSSIKMKQPTILDVVQVHVSNALPPNAHFKYLLPSWRSRPAVHSIECVASTRTNTSDTSNRYVRIPALRCILIYSTCLSCRQFFTSAGNPLPYHLQKYVILALLPVASPDLPDADV